METAKPDRPRRSLDRGLVAALIAVIILNGAASWSSSRYYSDQTKTAEHHFAVRLCQSGNKFKHSQNDSNRKTKAFLVLVSKRATAQAKIDTGKKHKLDLQYAAVYAALAASYHIAPPTNCGKVGKKTSPKTTTGPKAPTGSKGPSH